MSTTIEQKKIENFLEKVIELEEKPEFLKGAQESKRIEHIKKILNEEFRG